MTAREYRPACASWPAGCLARFASRWISLAPLEGHGAPAVWLRTDGNVSVCSMLRRDLPGFLCQGAKGSAARKGGRTVKTCLGSVQVETQDGDDQLRLDPAADLLVHCKAGVSVLVIPSAHGQCRYVAGIVIQHLVARRRQSPGKGSGCFARFCAYSFASPPISFLSSS